MSVTELLASANALVLQQNSEINEKWIDFSLKLGGVLPASLLKVSFQDAGRLDIIVRSLEKEFSQDNPTLSFPYNMQPLLSDLWISSIYSALWTYKRKSDNPNDRILEIFSDIDLIRQTNEKHELPKDTQILKRPLELQKGPNTEDVCLYDPKDKKRFHIAERGISERGSCMWHVINLREQKAYWRERQEISDKLLQAIED